MSLQATGGSAMKAVEVLIEHGVPEERIIFINLVRTSTSKSGRRKSLSGSALRLHLQKVSPRFARSIHP